MALKAAEDASFQPVDLSSYRRSENLALVFQEMFTVIVRLRSERQAVANAASFRASMLGVMREAEEEARTKGYSTEDIRFASFAVVAFLDESILNSRNPVFADWARQPLQVELFGSGVAGEIFFRDLEGLLSRKDSTHLADLLEVHYLCLLLGYRGRYSLSSPEGLRSVMDSVAEKIRRIRGSAPALSAAWLRSAEPARPRRSDPWVRRLFYGAVACLVLASVLFLVFKISIGNGLRELQATSMQGGR